jgi:hypothetical protein
MVFCEVCGGQTGEFWSLFQYGPFVPSMRHLRSVESENKGSMDKQQKDLKLEPRAHVLAIALGSIGTTMSVLHCGTRLQLVWGPVLKVSGSQIHL